MRVHAQVFEVFLDHAAVLRAVAGVHDEELHLEGHAGVPVQLLHELGQQHRILAAGDAHRDLVPRLYELIVLDRLGEVAPYFFVELFAQAVFHLVLPFARGGRRLLALHLLPQPFDVAAGQAPGRNAALAQLRGQVQAHLAPRAVQHDLPPGKLARVQHLPHLFLGSARRSGDEAVFAAEFPAQVVKRRAALERRVKLPGRNFQLVRVFPSFFHALFLFQDDSAAHSVTWIRPCSNIRATWSSSSV